MAAFWFGRKDSSTVLTTTPPSVIPPTLTSTPEGTFSLVVLPDTQGYKKGGEKGFTNETLANHISWILENLSWQKIAFVSHVGDIVDRNDPAQWSLAKSLMSRLDGKVPYAISVGNHDMGNKGDSTLFQKYFPPVKFQNYDWYGGYYLGDSERPYASGNNANSYQLISQEGLDLLLLHLECNAPDGVLRWANMVIENYPDRIVLITTHMDLGPTFKPESSLEMFTGRKGRMNWKKIHGAAGNSPQDMWNKCYKLHPNVRMIFCGDQRRSAALMQMDRGIHGNKVYSLLSDYSPLSTKQLLTLKSLYPHHHLDAQMAQVSPLRLCRFYPYHGEVHVMTYDTRQLELVDATPSAPQRESHQIILRNVFKPVSLRF